MTTPTNPNWAPPQQPVDPRSYNTPTFNHMPPPPPLPKKSWVVAVLLSLFLGVLGIDRFYLGHNGVGIAKLFTAGGLGVWALVDFILILTRSVNSRGFQWAD